MNGRLWCAEKCAAVQFKKLYWHFTASIQPKQRVTQSQCKHVSETQTDSDWLSQVKIITSFYSFLKWRKWKRKTLLDHCRETYLKEEICKTSLELKSWDLINQMSSSHKKTKDRGREYTRTFSKSWYDKKKCLTACSQSNMLFCFPCLLFQTGGSDPAWIKTGVNDLRHFPKKAETHEQTSIHMENTVKLVKLFIDLIRVQKRL